MKTKAKRRKIFSSLKKAENYQQKLYDTYNHVRLVDWPRFGEAGRYTWEIGK